ncbi:MAG: hypothetical protein ABII06_01400 [Pseudomonadota bacterium]
MKREKKATLAAALALCVAWAFLLTGCATTGKHVEGTCKANIEWDIAPEAEVTQFDCKMTEIKKKPALIFTAAVKNVTEKPMRYRVNVFLLDMDKAMGHLVPALGKPPVVPPGKTVSVNIPFLQTDRASQKIMVRVKTLSD